MEEFHRNRVKILQQSEDILYRLHVAKLELTKTGLAPTHGGHSVNRNRSVRFLGYLRNSVSTKLRIDRLARELGTEEIRSRLVWFGFG